MNKGSHAVTALHLTLNPKGSLGSGQEIAEMTCTLSTLECPLLFVTYRIEIKIFYSPSVLFYVVFYFSLLRLTGRVA